MGRSKAVFVCQECGHESPKWLGRCPACSAWNAFVEERASSAAGPAARTLGTQKRNGEARPLRLLDARAAPEERTPTGLREFDRVLGGGIVAGAVVLVGGDPGIGKSTLLLQVMNSLGATLGPVLYISGEESAQQVRLRAERLGAVGGDLFFLAETDLSVIEAALAGNRPRAVVVDSIQTVFHPDLPAAPGSVTQVRECAAALLRWGKAASVPVFLVGHVTKSGELAGPRVLEHIVDTVLYFEGERQTSFRLLRAVKNRFGPTHEVGIFEMTEAGLSEVENPSRLFLAERPPNAAGSVVIPAMEGTRPVLVEVQALVGSTNFMGTPRRLVTGADYNRVAIVLAVLEKRAGLALGSQDVYVNVVGGVRVQEPAADLGLALAVASSLRNVPVGQDTVAVGEVGLAGEVRSVARLEYRLSEAAKLGFTRAVIPATNREGLRLPKGLAAVPVRRVEEALEECVAR
ncbi:MAG: DNA repair protein RadA [Bacillota bacterium]|nr:DNA repair protein RadA [Bacillota bacterium]